MTKNQPLKHSWQRISPWNTHDKDSPLETFMTFRYSSIIYGKHLYKALKNSVYFLLTSLIFWWNTDVMNKRLNKSLQNWKHYKYVLMLINWFLTWIKLIIYSIETYPKWTHYNKQHIKCSPLCTQSLVQKVQKKSLQWLAVSQSVTADKVC